MNNNQQRNSISDKVLNKIKSGEIKMKPKIYFILRAVLLILSALVLALLIICLVSFIIFSLRSSGILFLPKFGFPGIRIFLSSLPWLFILIAITLIILLEIFTKRFTFVYRWPIIYSLLAIIFIVMLGSFVIDKTPFHSNLFWRAQEGRLPAIGKLYHGYGVPRIGNVHYGVVSEVIDGGFKIETLRGEELIVMVSSKTRFLLKTDIKKDDAIVVLGERNNNTVQAIDIRKVEKNINLFPSQRPRGYKPFLEIKTKEKMNSVVIINRKVGY
jgi:hypothetical protein